PMYCKNVLIEGITITHSPFWTVNPEFCENVIIKAVTINNPKSPNTDGINPESCRYVHISDCHISVGDDCITIKSGKDVPGRTKAIPAENYTITNCTMLSGHGGVVIGSEMSGGVKKITISNCVFDGTDRGIRIKTTRGRGGIVEDIRVDNIVMKNIRDQAIVLDMEYSKTQPEAVSERTPRFRNIRLSNITAYTKRALYINGLAEMPVQEISMHDVFIEAETGVLIRNAADIELHNLRVNTKTGPLLSAENTNRLLVHSLSTSNPMEAAPMVRLTQVQHALLRNHWLQGYIRTFAEIKGNSTTQITMQHNLLAGAGIAVDSSVNPSALIIIE
ncbi:MAG TPA: glycosyl hydrolase family 28 protein, partial [Phnomibacter sp.]|nr:glycosyl hydrolase family 28 protein [Phnomibacter sp.]